MIASDFLQKVLMKYFAFEQLKYMSVFEGSKIIDQAFGMASNKVNKRHRRNQNHLIRIYERKLAGKDVAHPDAKTKSVIEELNQKMDQLDKIRIRNLQKLERQRREVINYYEKNYWGKNKMEKMM
jgi:hypothetical protein